MIHVLKKRDILYLLALIFILNLALGNIFRVTTEKSDPVSVSVLSDSDSTSGLPEALPEQSELSPPDIKINARSACVLDFDTGTVLYEKNAYRKRPMASTTKIMTAIVALENSTPDVLVPISGKAANMGGSVMGLKEGSQVLMKDLLYGMLLCSGNDAAVAIAEYCGGSVSGFAEMMNKKAVEIGAYETSFSNPHGLDAENHYTTAYDLAKIARYALKNPVFSLIVGTQEYQYGGRTLRSTNEMLQGYEGADGVKTGYTGLAGRCLVTSATRNGMRLISAVLFCDTKNQRTISSSRILDYSFGKFGYVDLLEQGSIMGEVDIDRGIEMNKINVGVSDDVVAIMSNDKRDMLFTRVSLPERLTAPVQKGAILGTVSVFQGERIIAESSLIAMESVSKKTIKNYINQVIDNWFRIMR